MTNSVQTQASKVWQTLTAPETAATYAKAGTLTWTLLKDIGYLIWLVLCLGLVAGEWIWKTGYKTGWEVRDWVNNLDKPKVETVGISAEAGATLVESLKAGLNNALIAAKTQLGMEVTVDEPVQPPVTVATPPAPPAPPVSLPASPVAVETKVASEGDVQPEKSPSPEPDQDA